MLELRADGSPCAEVVESFLCLGGAWPQRKGKKVTEFFPPLHPLSPREGAASFQHFLRGQTPSSRGQTKMALECPSRFAETEAIETWWSSSTLFLLCHGFGECPDDYVTMTRLTLTAMTK